MLDNLIDLKRSENGWFQGGVFIVNLLVRSIRHCIISSRCKSSIGTKTWENLQGEKSSDTLFVLGSGQSVAHYSNRQFEEISRHNSAGFNFWLLHEFVPTYYIGEFKPASVRSDILWKNLAIRAEDYRTTPIIFKYSSTFWEERHLVPSQLEKTFVSSHLSVPGMTKKSHTRWMVLLDFLKMFSGFLPGGLILFRQASLSWLLAFALLLGYRKIVLCGVDLNSPKYFYDVDGGYCRSRRLCLPPPEFTSSVHPSNVPEYCTGNFTISEVIQVMNVVCLKKRGIKLFVGAESSALFPSIPLYPWPKEKAAGVDVDLCS